MCRCHVHRSCHGCCQAINRRHFLQSFGVSAAMTMSGLTSLTSAATDDKARKVRVAVVFLANTKIREIWPYPGFDTEQCQRKILALLEEGCPGIEFTPLTVVDPNDVRKAVALNGTIDGYLIYVMTLDWGLRGAITEIGSLGKPMVVADEFLGGSGVFLTGYSELCSRGIPAVAVATTRLSDLVAVVNQFANVLKPGFTPALFARRCEQVYRKTFAPSGKMKCTEDPVVLTDVGECVKRFREVRFLIIGSGAGGQEQDFLGAKGRYVGFSELM
ncbi:MAG: hypothetical protein ACYS80_25600, partial [Planctomycetota bacterium]